LFLFISWIKDRSMLRVFRLVVALSLMASPLAALAQKSSGHIDLEDMSGVGPRLVVVRVMISKTDAICPQQTGTFRIGPHGSVYDILLVRRGDQYWRMDATPDPDDFTFRRRVTTDSCRIDIDISEQQKRNDEWVLLSQKSSTRANAGSDDVARKTDDPPAMSHAEHEAYRRAEQALAHAGNLRQGVTLTLAGGVGFEGMDGCFEAAGTYLIDQGGVTLLFQTGLGPELNRFFIERVDSDADHSTLYLSNGSCRVGFTISASTMNNESWIPLPIAPPVSSKSRQGDERN
jgi:hypothetical protein